MYSITDIQQGTALDIAGATATLLRDGIAIGTIVDHGDGEALDLDGIAADERAALDAHARLTHESTEAFLEDLIRRTVDGRDA
jgi:hypothetical protein